MREHLWKYSSIVIELVNLFMVVFYRNTIQYKDSAAGEGSRVLQQQIICGAHFFLLGSDVHMNETMFRIRRHIPATQGEAESYIGLELN